VEDTWGSAYLAAQASYLRHLSAAPVVDVIESAGVYAVRTRTFSNSENGVLSDAGAQVSGAVVRRLIGWFQEWKVPASWLCAEGASRAKTGELLEAVGCQPERSAREMRASLRGLDLDAAAIPDGVRIEPVASTRDLDAWLDVAGACGWFESDHEQWTMRKLYLGSVLAGSARLRFYLALRRGAPVGMASAFYAGRIVLLRGVAVLSDVRRQGIGRALALTRLREAGGRGCEVAVLGPSPAGTKLYEALGFDTYPQPSDRCFYLPPPQAPIPRVS
jgi:GNAT superfamily N-acetyltransferase